MNQRVSWFVGIFFDPSRSHRNPGISEIGPDTLRESGPIPFFNLIRVSVERPVTAVETG
jgi:hypothetical protein